MEYRKAFRPVLQPGTLQSISRSDLLETYANTAPSEDSTYPVIDAKDKELILKACERLVGMASTEQERIASLSNASDLYLAVGEPKLARDVLVRHVGEVKASNELLTVLAQIERKQGNKTESLKWSERALRSTHGHSSRIQWGSYVVRQLIDLAPEECAYIMKTSLQVLADALATPDAMSGRNLKNLNRLADAMDKWGKEHRKRLPAAQIKKLQELRCSAQKDVPNFKSRCKELLGRISRPA